MDLHCNVLHLPILYWTHTTKWDEDKKHGSHYHKLKNGNTRIADENGETHIQPGTEVEEDE